MLAYQTALAALCRRNSALIVGVVALAFHASACSSVAADDGTGGHGGGGSDGKFHPKTDGVAMDEASACDSLHTALETKGSQLGCTMTLRTCPSLVQLVAGKPCAQFDQGSVKGCALYYSQATDCTDLGTRSQSCAFVAIPSSAPKGCPAN